MRYQPTLNIHNLTQGEIKRLHPGQWVTTTHPSDKAAKGIYLGVKASGSVVVAWYMNARGHRGGLTFRGYVKTLRQYANA
jgi:hypothetical protein